MVIFWFQSVNLALEAVGIFDPLMMQALKRV
jgi:hypothetical protein